MDQYKYPPASQSWIIWCLGVAFYFSGFFHRMVTAVMADQLMADFRIGAAALGNFSSFYYYSYVAVQIPTGILADSWGPMKLLTVGTLLASFGGFYFCLIALNLYCQFGQIDYWRINWGCMGLYFEIIDPMVSSTSFCCCDRISAVSRNIGSLIGRRSFKTFTRFFWMATGHNRCRYDHTSPILGDLDFRTR